MPQQLKHLLETRYATKVFDAEKSADSSKVEALLASLRFTPSSLNSQPWHVMVITDPALKQKLTACAWESNKAKYVDASHLFVFCRKSDYSMDDLSATVALNDKVRNMTTDTARLNMMHSYLTAMHQGERIEWMNRQVYLMLGQFLSSCAWLGLDSCPVEGFKPDEMDKLLDLEAQGWQSVVSAVVGVASPEDFNALERAPKVRYEQAQVLTVLDGTQS